MAAMNNSLRGNVFLMIVGLAWLAGGCAQTSEQREDSRVSRTCPAGSTMMCEANTVGRMRHGTFARTTDKCACVQDGAPTLNSPVIPSVRQ